MRFVLVTGDSSVAKAAEGAYGTHYELQIYSDWGAALENCKGANLIFVDLLATLNEPGKIQGYEEFAHAKMGHPVASEIPLVVIAPPADYELDAMVGWPGFVFAMVRRPVSERIFRQASGWV